jgi:hypothetical protein
VSAQRLTDTGGVVHLCTERDVLWLYYCEGCLEQFPTPESRELHVWGDGDTLLGCHAYRDYIIQEKLNAQARDDGREIADEDLWP